VEILGVTQTVTATVIRAMGGDRTRIVEVLAVVVGFLIVLVVMDLAALVDLVVVVVDPRQGTLMEQEMVYHRVVLRR
jgi:hypothetical protein